jgi:hypothetical protein
VTTATKEIRLRVAEMVAAKKTRTAVSNQEVLKLEPKEKKGFLTLFLGCCILVLSVAIFVAMATKGRMAEAMVGSVESAERIVIEKEPIQNSAYATKAEVERGFTDLNKRLDDINKIIAVWSHRVWLLGVAHNENVNIKQRMDHQYTGVLDSGYIVFDENWKLNRMPQTLQFSDDQKEEIRKSVR